MNRREIKIKAESQFLKRYWFTVGLNVVGALLIAVTASVAPASILVYPIIQASLMYANLKRYRGEEADVNIGSLFAGFKSYGHVLGGMWYMTLFIYLWSLLFIIPGIIKSIAYSMTPYILMDQPELSAKEALGLSVLMTYGHKWQIFVMYLSFIGWQLLNIMSFGIVGVFYVDPYYNMSLAGIYDSLKNNGTVIKA